MQKLNNIVIEHARIGFRNFAGVPGKYNNAGNKNFCIFFDHDTGATLENDGWNVRWLQPKNEDEEAVPYLQVAVSFGAYPPNITIVTSKGKTRLEEEDVKMLDWAEIENVDVTIRPYTWEVNGKSGVKAYLKSLWVTLVEDQFESKYHDVPDSAVNSLKINEGN